MTEKHIVLLPTELLTLEKFLEISKARREELNDISVKNDYLARLQKQAKLFVDNDVRVLGDKREYYGPELPF